MNPFDQFDESPAQPKLAPGGLGGLYIAKPVDPLKVPIAQANLTRTNQQIGQANAEAPYAGPKAAADARKAIADAKAAEITATRAAVEAGPPVDPKLAGAIQGLGLDELLASVAAARREIGRGTATGITGTFMRKFDGTTANDLKGSIDSIQGAMIMEKLKALKDASKTGASGMGALSEREGARLAASVAALGTNLSDDKLLEGLATIERHANALRAVGAGENPENPEVAKKYGILLSQPPKTTRTLSNDGTTGAPMPSDVVDPALKGVNEHTAKMMRAGATEPEVRAYLNAVQPGMGDSATGIAENIQIVHQYPEYKPNVITQMPKRQLGIVEGAVNAAAQSAGGAGVIGAADMLSGGTLDNMSANPELTRAGMAGVAAAHPIANFVGQTAGAVGAGLGAEMGAARMGVGKIGATLAGDALPGIAYGAGSADDGSRFGGGLTGGLAGIAGGLGGRAIGRAVSGVADAGVKRLSDAGIRMTVPQMLGGAYKGLEDRLSGLPGFKGLIGGARTRGLEDANQAVFNESVVAPIAAIPSEAIGEAGVNNLADTVSAGYKDALGGKSAQIDPHFTQQWGAISQAVPQIPNVGAEVQAGIAQNVGPMFNNGVISGESMQAVDRGLGDLKSKYVDHPLFATHIAPAIDAANDAVSGLFARQAPEVMPAYEAAKATYRNLSTVSDAVNAAVNTNGMVMPAQLGTAARNNAKKFGSAISAAKGNRPFFQLQRDMQNILPSKIPDPGTAGQMVIPGALALLGGGGGAAANAGGDAGDVAQGGGAGLVGGLGLAGALASPYLARGAIQRLLTANRGPGAKLVGEVIGRSRLGLPGTLGLPSLLTSGQ